MEPSRLAFGIGRVGVDHLVTATATGDRFDSQKINCVPTARRLSGSVPTILQTAASHDRVFARLVVPSVESSQGRWIHAQVRSMGLEASLEPVDSIVNSVVVHDKTGHLKTMLVMEETADAELPAEVGRQMPLDDVTVAVADGHQVHATLALAERCQEANVPLLFDPGSTFSSPRRASTTAAIGPLATIVIASEDFASQFLSPADVLATASRLPPNTAKLWIITHHDGGLSIITRAAHSHLAPCVVSPQGSSLGVGDLFRGTILRELLIQGLLDVDAEITQSDAERVAREARAVAIWRLETDEFLPRVPTVGELEPYRARASAI